MFYLITAETIALIISSFAFIVSVWTIKNATDNTKKQIVVDKVEEIYEITSALFYYYEALRSLYFRLKDSHNFETFDAKQRKELLEVYSESLKMYKERIDFEQLSFKISRLKILANTYLEGELKLNVLAYNDLFEKLIQVSFNASIMMQEAFYKEGFPDNLKLHDFLEKLQNEFVKKISLSKSSITAQEISKFRETHFKKALNLK